MRFAIAVVFRTENCPRSIRFPGTAGVAYGFDVLYIALQSGAHLRGEVVQRGKSP
jgi:hypothetical protein